MNYCRKNSSIADGDRASAPKIEEREASEIRFVATGALDEYGFALRRIVGDGVCAVHVVPLQIGAGFPTFADALSFISGYDEARSEATFAKYEVSVRYSDDSKIEGVFNDKKSAIDFLNRVSRP